MIAMSLTLLFTAVGLFALGAIALTWREYGEAALHVFRTAPDLLADCSDMREVRYAIFAVPVQTEARGLVLRADFSARRRLAAPGRLAA